MAWNEPGKDDKDPWGNSGGQDGPPDLDEVVRKMQDKLAGLFGGKKSGKSSGQPPGEGKGGRSSSLLIPIGLLVLALLVYNSIHIIDEPERGVVLRFGKYVTTIQPGLNFRLPKPIEQVYKVNVRKVQPITDQASMLTKDENIVDIDMAIQYRVNEAKDYLFNVDMPDFTLKQVAKTAIREVIGNSDMDFLLTEGRTKIESDTRELMQSILDQYKAGLTVESVNMQSAKPPEEVRNAFDDAIKAREDKQRLVNQAEAYHNEVLPQARGESARLKEDALAYEARVREKAVGEASRFEQLLNAYEKAPQVTRERLYLDSIESVMVRNKKIFLDTGGGDKILYLPIDGAKTTELPAPAYRSSQNSTESSQVGQPDSTATRPDSSDSRARSTR